MVKDGRSPAFARLFSAAGIDKAVGADSTVADAFEVAFSKLKRAGSRDDYVYRSALTQKILLGRHSLRTASLLSEFRAGKSKADLVILNGTAAAYEIKSERDSLSRLANQIQNYKKVFSVVNIIANDRHIKHILTSVPEDVGVLHLNRRYQITVEREAVDSPECVCPVAIFESLRLREAQEVLKRLGIDIPDVPNTMLHREMKAVFSKQDPATVHREMVATLKKTRNLATLAESVESLPSSLHAAVLSMRLKAAERQKLAQAVSVRLPEALHWD